MPTIEQMTSNLAFHLKASPGPHANLIVAVALTSLSPGQSVTSSFIFVTGASQQPAYVEQRRP